MKPPFNDAAGTVADPVSVCAVPSQIAVGVATGTVIVTAVGFEHGQFAVSGTATLSQKPIGV